MAKVIVHSNLMLDYIREKCDKLDYTMEQLNHEEFSSYLKKGYLYMPYGKFTNEHKEAVLNLLKLSMTNEKTRRNDIILSVLEANQ